MDTMSALLRDILTHSIIDGSVSLELIGNRFHELQDFYSHSNWVELFSHNDPNALVNSIPTYQGATDDQKERYGKDVKTGKYGKDSDPKDPSHHDKMNKDCSSSPYFQLADAVAERAAKEAAAALIEDLKKNRPDIYDKLTQPLSDEERKVLQRKYDLYKELAKRAGHWGDCVEERK